VKRTSYAVTSTSD